MTEIYSWLFYIASIVLDVYWKRQQKTLQLVQFTSVQARLQRWISYVINMKTHDGTGHKMQISPPPRPSTMPQSHRLLFPTYLKINATEEEITNTFPKLTFHA